MLRVRARKSWSDVNSIKGDEVGFQRHKGCGGWGTIKKG